ncbi:hypothetical protein [Tropicibacter sp. S64]|uniref:hypothetical protein n=1 Tax=Tropicibacter sp. S64 TaxID=3415122 RepID=UPI003C7A3F0C
MASTGMSQHETHLDALGRLMRGWPGEALDPRGIVRIVNRGGSKPPIFWVFNARHEPENFARELGQDQPLIYARSLHLVMPPDQDRAAANLPLARYYAQVLTPNLTGLHLFLGANCQGARLMLELTRILRGNGGRVSGVCVISALPDIEVGVPALLIYGSRDPQHDPFFFDAVSAQKQASRCFATVRRIVIDAGHGQYAVEGTVETVVARVQEFSVSLNSRPVFSA